MEAGKLRCRVIFERPTTTQKPNGEEIVTWATGAVTAYASIEQLTGREAEVASAIAATADSKIRTRYVPALAGLNAKWRIRYGSTIYNIEAPPKNVDMRNREWEILVSSGINEG